MISEFAVRKAYYDRIQQFADDNNLKIIFPFNENDDEPTDDNGNHIFPDFADEDIFLRPRIVSLAPRTLGIRNGVARYKWIVQINIYSRQGIGESDAARIADQLREEFSYGDRLLVEKDKYTQQIINARLESPIPMGTWIALPFIFTISQFS